MTQCPAEQFLSILSGKWTILILLRISQNEPVRFGALKRSISGISSRVLTERLRLLEQHGFIVRDFKPTIPPEVSYALSPRGCELRKLLADLDALAHKWDMVENGD